MSHRGVVLTLPHLSQGFCCPVSFFFFKFIYFERVIQRVRTRPSVNWFTPQKAVTCQRWARLKLGARAFIRASHVGGRVPNTWVNLHEQGAGWKVEKLGPQVVVLPLCHNATFLHPLFTLKKNFFFNFLKSYWDWCGGSQADNSLLCSIGIPPRHCF